MAAFIASAPWTSSGRKYSPSSHRSPTFRIPAANPCSIAATRSPPPFTTPSASLLARAASPWTTASFISAYIKDLRFLSFDDY